VLGFFFRCFDRDRQRREQEARQCRQEKSRQVEERRIVYVGKIIEGTTRADLRTRFEVFGPIEEISVHYRDHG
jgi:alpha peroxisome proliferator-activated receptor gamma coactivator 1-alpha